MVRGDGEGVVLTLVSFEILSLTATLRPLRAPFRVLGDLTGVGAGCCSLRRRRESIRGMVEDSR